MNRKKKVAAIFLVLALIIAGTFYYKYFRAVPDRMVVSGIVEAPEVNVSSLIAGRIMTMPFREGDRVEKGQKLIELENNELKAAVAQARTQVDRAGADILVAKAGIETAAANVEIMKAQMRNAQAVVAKAVVQLANAGRQLERYSELVKADVVSKEAYDTAETTFKAAQAEHEAARALLSQQQAKMSEAFAQKASAQSQVAAAEAGLEQAKAGLAFAKARFDQSIIVSPIAGTIVYKALEEGEAVSAGMTILTIVDLKNPTVRIDVEETQVGRLRVGMDVQVDTQGDVPTSLQGKIKVINPYAEFATQKDVTRGRQDIKTFKVLIAVDDPKGYLKPGMTVDTVFFEKGTP